MDRSPDQIAADFKRIRKEQPKIAREHERITSEISSIEREIQRYLDKKWAKFFPGKSVSIHAGLSGGCACPGWKPSAYIYQIDNRFFTCRGWAHDPNHSWELYASTAIFGPCPVDEEKLNQFIAQVKEDLKINFSIHREKLKGSRDIQYIRNTADFHEKFPKIEILEEGEIWYTGWDISDHYFIGKRPDEKIEVWWSVNGHGFGLDSHAKAGDKAQLDKFYSIGEVDPGITKEEILKSWQEK